MESVVSANPVQPPGTVFRLVFMMPLTLIVNKDQLSLTNPRDALQHGEREGGRSV